MCTFYTYFLIFALSKQIILTFSYGKQSLEAALFLGWPSYLNRLQVSSFRLQVLNPSYRLQVSGYRCVKMFRRPLVWVYLVRKNQQLVTCNCLPLLLKLLNLIQILHCLNNRCPFNAAEQYLKPFFMPIAVINVFIQPYCCERKQASYNNGDDPCFYTAVCKHGRCKKKGGVKRHLQPKYAHYAYGG